MIWSICSWTVERELISPAPAPQKSPCAKIDAQFGGRWENDPEDKGPREGEAPAADVEGDAR